MSITITENNDSKNKKKCTQKNKFCIRFLENCSLKSEEKQGT